ncbi:MAG: CRISPR-associated helicase Cas3' [Telmatospirillum sp.]|nr:CRISPR-associated helicase Cas3' [Telmatospirillum sp.]
MADGRWTEPWGKTDGEETHHLAHHSADVAACFKALVRLPVIRDRLCRAAGRSLTMVDLARLAVLVFLHDAGKLHPGFQAKGWPEAHGLPPRHGHLAEGAAIFLRGEPPGIAASLYLDDLISWGLDPDLLMAVIGHHGEPVPSESRAMDHWDPVPAMGYDPVAAAVVMGRMIARWFPEAFVAGGDRLPGRPAFAHLFCGLVSLADWLGSTRAAFPFVSRLDPDYLLRVDVTARDIVTAVGLDVSALRSLVPDDGGFSLFSGRDRPRPQQSLIGRHSLEDRLLILEADTGSGKTEAALWRFFQLFAAGKVDGLYFALPTRAAAAQLHGRVQAALRRMFADDAPEAVLALPGYLVAGEHRGQALPGWEVHWDDDDGRAEGALLRRWAAEHGKRRLAATVAVGTVDQAMLAAMQVRHAHLRAASLARSLLVIDEVHASDRYMTEVQSHLLSLHLGWGGHALLMSAPLGSVARGRWLGQGAVPAVDEARAAPYPALWGGKASVPVGLAPADQARLTSKAVSMVEIPRWSAETAAGLALEAARAGGRVLVIRNTVAAAVATFAAGRAAGGTSLLLTVAGGPALHHSRCAPEDRALLDRAVETALSPEGRVPGGVIVIGTQTLEQSLDIDADRLITDLCPVDVLLQRLGRLHRHPLSRPDGFFDPVCQVLCPEGGLERLLTSGMENGLGILRRKNGDLVGVYRDLSVLELTRRLILTHPCWRIPDMNRLLVESATHETPIDALHQDLGAAWKKNRSDVIGRDVADAGGGRAIVLPVQTPLASLRFPGDGERIRTRLGAEGARIDFAQPVVGPFGTAISGVTLPGHWTPGTWNGDELSPEVREGALRMTVGTLVLGYDRNGLTKHNGLS